MTNQFARATTTATTCRLLRPICKIMNAKKALEYLAQYAEQREQKGRIVLCRNMLADAILQYYQTLCKNNDVAFECLANLPQTLSIPDTDFSILFGNLLENAWEAARQTPEKCVYPHPDSATEKQHCCND